MEKIVMGVALMEMLIAYCAVSSIVTAGLIWFWVRNERPFSDYRFWTALILISAFWPAAALIMAVAAWTEKKKDRYELPTRFG